MRKLVASLVCAGGLAASSAQALDLGALHVYSEAGQPLDAEIQLFDVGGLSADDIRPRFAGVDDLALSGLDSKGYLADVRFFVAIEKDKSATLRLVSNQPINQSFLSFLLEVNWPQGRLLREYTALLKGSVKPAAQKSPPVLVRTAAEQVAVEVVAPAKQVVRPDGAEASASPVPPEGPVVKAMRREISNPVEPVRAVSVAAEPEFAADAVDKRSESAALPLAGEAEAAAHKPADVVERSHPIEITEPVFVRDSERVYVNEKPRASSLQRPFDPAGEASATVAPEVAKQTPVRLLTPQEGTAAADSVAVGAKETLWDIARRHRPVGGFSNQQVLLALYEKNPHAFVDGDINRMKGSAVLALPGADDLGRYSASEALRAVRIKLEESRKLAAKEMGAASLAKEVVVGAKDTLWDIAVKYRAGPEVNTRQMMLAIVKMNPHAFADGNINRMRTGVVLKMPTVDELRQWSEEEASAEVRRQISTWQSQEEVAADSAPRVVSTEAVSVAAIRQVPATDNSVVLSEPKRLVIGKKETLWTIAIENLPDESVTAGEMIKAIIKKNPHAFVDGNMNSMRVGETLEIPTSAEIRSLNGS